MRPTYLETALSVEECVQRIGEPEVLRPALGPAPPCETTTDGGVTALTAKWHGGARLSVRLLAERGGTLLRMQYDRGAILWAIVAGVAVVNPLVFLFVGTLIRERFVSGISNVVLFGLGGLAISALELPYLRFAFRLGQRKLFEKVAEAAEAEPLPDSGRHDLDGRFGLPPVG